MKFITNKLDFALADTQALEVIDDQIKKHCNKSLKLQVLI